MQRQVGDPELDAREPELSPDGRTIAFGGGPASSEALYVMDWDGAGVRRVSGYTVPGGGWGFVHQEWSSDGGRIVTQDGQGLPDIWVIEVGADGSRGANISASSRDEIIARFAPGDDAISWSHPEGTMLLNSGERRPQLVPTFVDRAIWSPDGQSLVGVNRAGDALVVVDRDGLVQAEIEALGFTGFPSWQRLAP